MDPQPPDDIQNRIDRIRGDRAGAQARDAQARHNDQQRRAQTVREQALASEQFADRAYRLLDRFLAIMNLLRNPATSSFNGGENRGWIIKRTIETYPVSSTTSDHPGGGGLPDESFTAIMTDGSLYSYYGRVQSRDANRDLTAHRNYNSIAEWPFSTGGIPVSYNGSLITDEDQIRSILREAWLDSCSQQIAETFDRLNINWRQPQGLSETAIQARMNQIRIARLRQQ